MAAVVTFARFPDEQPEFLAYLARTGDVWARAVADDPDNPVFAPASVIDFAAQDVARIEQYHVVAMYIGFRQDVLNPVIATYEAVEGGREVALEQFEGGGGVYKIVGGTKVRHRTVCLMSSQLVRYDQGQLRTPDELLHSNLCYYSGSYQTMEGRPLDGAVNLQEAQCQYVRKSDRFLKWARNVLRWMRRHTPASVRMYRKNYEIRASAEVAEAARSGLQIH